MSWMSDYEKWATKGQDEEERKRIELEATQQQYETKHQAYRKEREDALYKGIQRILPDGMRIVDYFSVPTAGESGFAVVMRLEILADVQLDLHYDDGFMNHTLGIYWVSYVGAPWKRDHSLGGINLTVDYPILEFHHGWLGLGKGYGMRISKKELEELIFRAYDKLKKKFPY